MDSRRTLAGASLVCALLFLPAVAHGQVEAGTSTCGAATGTSGYAVQLSAPNPTRLTPTGTPYPSRDANLNPNDINFQDCEDDIVLSFSLTETLPTTVTSPDVLEVWVGPTDCSQPTARSGGEGPFCWQVFPEEAPEPVVTVNIPARSITRFVDATLASVPEGGAIVSAQPESACRTQTTSGRVALGVYFLFLDAPGAAAVDSCTQYPIDVALVGPLAPTSVTAGIGDGLLEVQWTPQVDPSIQGFDLYAVDLGVGGRGPGADGGGATETTPVYCRSGDGGAYSELPDAAEYATVSESDLASMGCTRGLPVNSLTTAQGNAACTSSALVDVYSTSAVALGDAGFFLEGGASIGAVGISQVDYARYGVGSVGGGTTSSYSVTTIPGADGGSSRLVDGHEYAIAVAAYDGDGNVGLLSPLACQTPAPIVDFLQQYGQDGGYAGGGFCSVVAPGQRDGPFVVSVAPLVVFSLRRRRRRTHDRACVG